jgi:O-methyltransferase
MELYCFIKGFGIKDRGMLSLEDAASDVSILGRCARASALRGCIGFTTSGAFIHKTTSQFVPLIHPEDGMYLRRSFLDKLAIMNSADTTVPSLWLHKIPFHLFLEVAARSIMGQCSTDETSKFVTFQMCEAEATAIASRPVSEAVEKGNGAWPSDARACSMVGLLRLRGLGNQVKQCLDAKVAGDIVETGVWRGGCCILAALVLKYYCCADKLVHMCDSFEGLPPPNPAAFPHDRLDTHYTHRELAVSQASVLAYVVQYDVEKYVRMHKGWFCDSMPLLAPRLNNQLCVLRLDGDMYESTIQVLDALYAHVQPKGFIIVDDWTLSGARAAVLYFRETHMITAAIVEYGDGMASFWKKE